MSESPNPGPDIDDLVDRLVRGEPAQFHKLFEGARAPHLQWSPAFSDLKNPKIRAFAKTCLNLTDAHEPISEAAFRQEDFAEHLPWMMVLEAEAEGTVFRYSHYGEGIANVRGLSMLGHTSADFGGHIGLFFTSTYRAILQRKEWLLADHVPPKEIFARKWERLIVPIVTDTGAVCRFVAINLPDNELRAGLEIIPDPVMILDADQIVRYANPAARRLFDRSEYPSQDLNLFEYSGIHLPLEKKPGDLVRTRAVQDKVCLAMRDNLLQDFFLTISGARLWGHDFYVVTLRVDIRTS